MAAENQKNAYINWSFTIGPFFSLYPLIVYLRIMRMMFSNNNKIEVIIYCTIKFNICSYNKRIINSHCWTQRKLVLYVKCKYCYMYDVSFWQMDLFDWIAFNVVDSSRTLTVTLFNRLIFHRKIIGCLSFKPISTL